MSISLEHLKALPQFQRMCESLRAGGSYVVRGPVDSGAASIAASLMDEVDGPALVVCPGVEAAEEFAEDASLFRPGLACCFPPLENLPGEHEEPDEAILSSRVAVLRHMVSEGEPAGDVEDQGEQWLEPGPNTRLVSVSINALLQPTCSADYITRGSRSVKLGDEVGPHELVTWLVENGFSSVPRVELRGQYSLRGGILDVFSFGAERPVRIEFFGEEVDSLREFDPGTQLSSRRVQQCHITAVRAPRGDGDERGQDTLFNFLPDDAPVFVLEPKRVQQRAEELEDEDLEWLLPLERIRGELGSRTRVLFAPDGLHEELPEVEVASEQRDAFGADLDDVLTELGRICRDFSTTCIFCITDAERDRLRRLLDDREFEARDELTFARGRLNHGAMFPEAGLALIPHQRLFNRYRQRRVQRHVEEGRPIQTAQELQPGDLVVHVEHGIGKFHGIKMLERKGEQREHLEIEFDEDVHLYVPSDRVELVHRYIGVGGRRPQLSKIRSARWRRAKKKAMNAVEDLASELLEVQALRETQQGIQAPPDGEWQRQFESEFPYEETEDQIRAIEAVKSDMQSPHPMDRLICGDVGYGKTEVAMRAAFKAIMGGRQVAVLVPTTVLAQQHFRTFTERMADYPIRVEMLSRFLTGSETRAVLEGMADGSVDVVIGTHKLLQDNVSFKNLGLVVIDEEQRFGVAHKEKLKKLRSSVDVLTLTATPIPRTLHMSLLGLRDISALQTPPRDRHAIETVVQKFDPETLRHAIMRELNREGQVFVVHNRVNSIRGVAHQIREIVPEAQVGIAHGQMRENDLAHTMEKFMDQQLDVLVCTTIIENGLDIPNANTMIMDRADLLGLAEMHQLRGRIGRYIRKAHAYLFTPRDRPITPEARKRLDAIKRYSRLGAGFDIAMRDLEIRGAGNILGPEQSGHIAAVGYNLYCRLLERATQRAKGEEVKEPPMVSVNLGLQPYLPDDYVPSPQQKIEVYRRLNRACELDEVREAREEMEDRFGPLPEEAESLVREAEIRVLAAKAGLDSVQLRDSRVHLGIRDRQKFEEYFEDAPGTVKMLDGDEALCTYRFPDGGPGTAAAVRKVLSGPQMSAD